MRDADSARSLDRMAETAESGREGSFDPPHPLTKNLLQLGSPEEIDAGFERALDEGAALFLPEAPGMFPRSPSP
jgi:hypothetical protein